MDAIDEGPERTELGGLRLGEASPIAKAIAASPRNAMTYRGVAVRTLALLALLVASGTIPWGVARAGGDVGAFLWLGLIVALVTGFASAARPFLAPALGPVYAVAEGSALGALAAIVEAYIPGAALHAFLLTAIVTAAMLILHLRWRPGARRGFRDGVFAMTIAIAAVYVVDLLLVSFGVRPAFLHESGLVGIAGALFVLAIAAFNLTIDLEFVQEQVERGAPNTFEWFAAVSIVSTLAWVYVEALRLLIILGGDDD